MLSFSCFHLLLRGRASTVFSDCPSVMQTTARYQFRHRFRTPFSTSKRSLELVARIVVNSNARFHSLYPHRAFWGNSVTFPTRRRTTTTPFVPPLSPFDILLFANCVTTCDAGRRRPVCMLPAAAVGPGSATDASPPCNLLKGRRGASCQSVVLREDAQLSQTPAEIGRRRFGRQLCGLPV